MLVLKFINKVWLVFSNFESKPQPIQNYNFTYDAGQVHKTAVQATLAM